MGQSDPNMTQNGSGLIKNGLKMAKNDPKWPNMAPNGPKWLWNDPKWPKMTKNCQIRPNMAKNDPKWPKMI